MHSSLEQVCVQSDGQAPPILQDVEVGFPLDRRVRNSFPSSQRLLVQTTIVESVRQRGGFIPVLGCFSDNSKLGTHQRRTPGSKASLLHKPSFLGVRSKIPEDREASLCLDHCIKEAPSLLPSTHDTGDDGPTIAKGHGQARCLGQRSRPKHW